jgi:glycosyltransferase involved in cell wall biosynthesis
MSQAPDVTVVVPVQTEDADVRSVVRALGGAIEKAGKSWEMLLVYDGVRGEAWTAGLDLQAQTDQRVRTIALHKPFGESVCLSSAFEHARGEMILTTPQYIQVDPAEVGGMIERLEQGADLVTGWRHPRVDAWLNRLQSAAFNRVLRLVVGTHFHDLNCTLRLIRREVLEQLTIYGNMYRYLPAIAHNQGFRVEEQKVRHLREQGGTGIFGPGVYVRRCLDVLALMFLAKFTHKPLRFFGALGGTGMLVGGGIALWEVSSNLFGSDQAGLYQRPLFLMGVLLFVLGVQLVGFGLVGEIVIFTQARNVREYRIERIHE